MAKKKTKTPNKKKPKAPTKKKTKDRNNPLGYKAPNVGENPHNLNIREFYFVEFYIQQKNGTAAARLAGFGGENATDNTLAVTANKQLRKVKIKAALADRYALAAMPSEEVLARLGDMARSFDMTQYIELKETYNFNSEGDREFAGYVVSFDLERLQKDGFSHLIKKIKQNGQGGIEIEWHDQMSALVHIGKSQSLFVDNVNLQGIMSVINSPDIIEQTREAMKSKTPRKPAKPKKAPDKSPPEAPKPKTKKPPKPKPPAPIFPPKKK